MAIPNKAITDAWADMKPQIDKLFAGDVTNIAIPPQQTSCDDLGLCDSLNSVPIGTHSPRNWHWQARGKGTLGVSGLTVTRLEGVSAASAAFSDEEVSLPIQFETMEVSGRYSVDVPCMQITVLVGETGSQNVSRTGRISETYKRGTLVYHVKNGVELAFIRVSIDDVSDYTGRDPETIGTPIGPDGPLRRPGYYTREVVADHDGGWWVDQLSGNWFREWSIGDAMKNAVLAANFSATMIATLKKRAGFAS
jgi:hypothetical protein